MCHWDCRKAKISLRFVSLLSTCSPQEMSFLWAPHRLRKGIGRETEVFLSLSVSFDQGGTSNRQMGRQKPLSQEKDESVCFFSLWRILTASKMHGEASNKCLYLFRQQNQLVVRLIRNQLAVTNSSSWDSSSVRIAVQRPCLSWLCGQESVPTNSAEALPGLLGHCRGCAHLQGVLVVNTFLGRWVFCKKAS